MAHDYSEKLASMIRIDTVSSYEDPGTEKFAVFRSKLEELFPTVFGTFEKESFGGSLLLRWRSAAHDSSPDTSDIAAVPNQKLPVLFMNHQDVVPAEGEWEHDPFSGDIEDGRIWGRGTLDDKGGLFAMLQAAEELAQQGFVPSRDIYFEMACTEETDGSGARLISEILSERGVRFEFVLDEGGMIVNEPIAGAKGRFAMIGVAEKSAVDLKFIARSKGGHASTPPKDTPLVRLGKFMAEADKGNVFETEIPSTVAEMFRRIAPSISGGLKFVLSHPRGFAPLLVKTLPGVSPAVGAMLHTTIAFTTCRGADAYNVIPQEAYVTGNMRVAHHQGAESSINAITALAKKYDLETEIIEPGVETHVTDYNGEAFKLLERGLAAILPDVKAVPYVMTGASDSRFMEKLTDQTLRFLPLCIEAEQMDSIHGRNEYLAAETLKPAVEFYRFLYKEV